MGRKPVWPPKVRHNKQRGADYIRFVRHGERREYYLGPHGSEKARAAYARLLVQLAAPDAGPPVRSAAPLTVRELLALYLTHAEKFYLRSRNYKRQIDAVKRAIQVCGRAAGAVAAKDFGGRSLKEVRAAMVSGSWLRPEERAQRSKAGQPIGWARSNCNAAVGILIRAFGWAVSEDLLPAAVHATLQRVLPLQRGECREGKGRVRPVAAAIVEATLPHLRPPVRALVQLLLLTGMRAGEACSMRPTDVSREGIDPAGVQWPGLWVYVPQSHKQEGDERYIKVVFLGERCQQILAPFLDRAADQPCFSPREAVRHGEGRGRGKPGAQYSPHSLGYAVRRAAARAGVPHWHPHQLRHALSTTVRAQFGLEHARAALGQESVAAALIYAEKDLAKAAEVARRMG